VTGNPNLPVAAGHGVTWRNSMSNQKSGCIARPEVVSDHYEKERAQQLRKLIADVRRCEIERMRAMREQNSFESATIGDEGDNAASDEEFEVTASLAELAGRRAAAAESALERFRDGRYGVCEECGDQIPIERLRAVPATVLCVECQREFEATSKQPGFETVQLWATVREPTAAVVNDSSESQPEFNKPVKIVHARRGRSPRPRSR
jgi:DnaK suppressor protein